MTGRRAPAPSCHRCGKHPQALDTGWCVQCLDAEDQRRKDKPQRGAGYTRYLTESQRRGGHLAAICRDLEDALYQQWSDDVSPRVLARDLGLPEDVIVGLITRASARDTAFRRGRGPRPTRRTRILATRKDAPGGTAPRTPIALEEGVHWARNGNEQHARTCPICRVVFEPARDDQRCCSPRCRRVKHRLDQGDPTAAETIAWLRNPPPCAGCDQPLAGLRVGAKYHCDACRKRAKRRGRAPGQARPTRPAQGASIGLEEGVHNPRNREDQDP